MEVLTMHNTTSTIAQSPNKVNYTLSLATFNPSYRQEAAN